jgi:hypothetical protein
MSATPHTGHVCKGNSKRVLILRSPRPSGVFASQQCGNDMQTTSHLLLVTIFRIMHATAEAQMSRLDGGATAYKQKDVCGIRCCLKVEPVLSDPFVEIYIDLTPKMTVTQLSTSTDISKLGETKFAGSLTAFNQSRYQAHLGVLLVPSIRSTT